MKQDYTHITMILDRSGSMTSLAPEVVGGLNAFLTEQRKVPGQATLTLVQFDSGDPYEILRGFESLDTVKDIGAADYVPRGMTPLLDAVGRGIQETGKRLSELSEDARPERVLFVIITDGLENASKEFTKNQVQQMIQEQTDNYKWQFVYLSSDINAIQEAVGFGVNKSATQAYAATGAGVLRGFVNLSADTKTYRGGGKVW